MNQQAAEPEHFSGETVVTEGATYRLTFRLLAVLNKINRRSQATRRARFSEDSEDLRAQGLRGLEGSEGSEIVVDEVGASVSDEDAVTGARSRANAGDLNVNCKSGRGLFHKSAIPRRVVP